MKYEIMKAEADACAIYAVLNHPISDFTVR